MYMLGWWLVLSKVSFPEVLKCRIPIAEWRAANGCKLDMRSPCGNACIASTARVSWDSRQRPSRRLRTGRHSITHGLSADDMPEKPTAALVDFIEAGKEPPLYIGWGSMAHESGQYRT